MGGPCNHIIKKHTKKKTHLQIHTIKEPLILNYEHFWHMSTTIRLLRVQDINYSTQVSFALIAMYECVCGIFVHSFHSSQADQISAGYPYLPHSTRCVLRLQKRM